METPVIACNEGGPTETIKNEETGFNLPSKRIDLWTEKMIFLAKNPEKAKEMGKKAKIFVRKPFGFEGFLDVVNVYFLDLQKKKKIA